MKNARAYQKTLPVESMITQNLEENSSNISFVCLDILGVILCDYFYECTQE